jgi:hypothetical protein
VTNTLSKECLETMTMRVYVCTHPWWYRGFSQVFRALCWYASDQRCASLAWFFLTVSRNNHARDWGSRDLTNLNPPEKSADEQITSLSRVPTPHCSPRFSRLCHRLRVLSDREKEIKLHSLWRSWRGQPPSSQEPHFKCNQAIDKKEKKERKLR